MVGHNPDIFDWIRDLKTSDQLEIDKLSAFFDRITAQTVGFAEKEIELARSMQDHESIVKVQVKMETLKYARRVFCQGYQIVTGRKAWDDDCG